MKTKAGIELGSTVVTKLTVLITSYKLIIRVGEGEDGNDMEEVGGVTLQHATCRMNELHMSYRKFIRVIYRCMYFTAFCCAQIHVAVESA